MTPPEITWVCPDCGQVHPDHTSECPFPQRVRAGQADYWYQERLDYYRKVLERS